MSACKYDQLKKEQRPKIAEDRQVMYDSLMEYLRRFDYIHWNDQYHVLKIVCHKVKEKGLKQEWK